MTPFSIALAPSDEKINAASGFFEINFKNKLIILLIARTDLLKKFGGGFEI